MNWSAVRAGARGGQEVFSQQSYDYPARTSPYHDRRQFTPADRVLRSYDFPTKFGGSFERAMSTFARSPTEKPAGMGLLSNDNFRSEVSQALALKLNLKTQQHANEKVLHEIVKSGGRCRTLKQAVQARAAVYDDVTEASWFVKNYDIGAKARLSKQRRIVRSQLIAAPLVVAQCGLRNICSMLTSGD